MNDEVAFAIRCYLALAIVCLPLALFLKYIGVFIWPVPLGIIGIATFWGAVACVWLALGRIMKAK